MTIWNNIFPKSVSKEKVRSVSHIVLCLLCTPVQGNTPGKEEEGKEKEEGGGVDSWHR